MSKFSQDLTRAKDFQSLTYKELAEDVNVIFDRLRSQNTQVPEKWNINGNQLMNRKQAKGKHVSNRWSLVQKILVLLGRYPRTSKTTPTIPLDDLTLQE